METQKNDESHLIHNENGEWINMGKVIFLFDSFASKLKAFADNQGKKFSIHKYYDGTPWCYRQEFEALNLKGLLVTSKEWRLLTDQYAL